MSGSRLRNLELRGNHCSHQGREARQTFVCVAYYASKCNQLFVAHQRYVPYPQCRHERVNWVWLAVASPDPHVAWYPRDPTSSGTGELSPQLYLCHGTVLPRQRAPTADERPGIVPPRVSLTLNSPEVGHAMFSTSTHKRPRRRSVWSSGPRRHRSALPWAMLQHHDRTGVQQLTVSLV